MNGLTDHVRALPATVIARCADDSCHGQQANGANALAADNPAQSLRVLSTDMHLSHAAWLAAQEEATR